MEKEEKSYCVFAASLPEGNIHKIYHDFHYGFMLDGDDELFGRLILEINQAGLSWDTILKKQDNFRKAYSNFKIKKIANYKEIEIDRLMNDTGIIRNLLKINAAIYNAQQILKIQKEFGSFQNWLIDNHPQDKKGWVKLFKSKFKFVGGEIVNEFLMSIGMLKGAHSESCTIYKKQLKSKPFFLSGLRDY